MGVEAEDDLPEEEDENLDSTLRSEAPLVQARKRNRSAYAALTMAFESEELIELLMDAQTTEWPSGLAWKVMEGLMEKYQLSDLATLIEYITALNKVSMKPKKVQ